MLRGTLKSFATHSLIAVLVANPVLAVAPGAGAPRTSPQAITTRQADEAASIPGAVEYGGFWIRFAAKFIDGLILGVFNMVLGIGFSVLTIPFMAADGEGSPAAMVPFILLTVLRVGIQLGAAVAYDTWFVGRYAATPGKMACGLKVVTEDLGRVTYMRALGRHFAEYVSVLTAYIGYIMAAFDEEKRTLHDRICNTRVIRK